jgi:Mlc titration factor MtfA (ptsG expression regulator)
MLNWLARLLRHYRADTNAIPEALWQQTLASYPFLARLSEPDQLQLKHLSSQFLASKEFSGAHKLVVTDSMALAIAAQACLPVLHLGISYYNEFKGIVLHPGPMLARREARDAAGVVHGYSEELAGEAMEGGPVTLSWQDVAASGESADSMARGYNVVIHEFVHKLDMHSAAGGIANGCPPLPSRATKAHWQATMQVAYAVFKEKLAMAERFGGEPPWLDAYGATAPAEFFAVASEAYFVNRERFEDEFPDLAALFDGFYLKKAIFQG